MALWRSLLYVPGNRPDLIAKIERFEADAYILDLEDGVPEAEKTHARQTFIEAAPDLIKRGHAVHVRVNPPHTPWHRPDLEAALSSGVGRIHLPKVASLAELREVDNRLVEMSVKWGMRLEEIELYPSIESSKALLEAAAIAAGSWRLGGLLLGADDLTAEWGVERTPEGVELDYARSRVAVAAHAAGVQPIDATFPFHTDLAGCERDALRARQLGFKGKQAVHPDQCPVLNRAFAPTEAEVARARAIVEAAADARREGRGTATAAGTQIDAAVEKAARRLLEWAAARP